jgi:hypothetical protein
MFDSYKKELYSVDPSKIISNQYFASYCPAPVAVRHRRYSKYKFNFFQIMEFDICLKIFCSLDF